MKRFFLTPTMVAVGCAIVFVASVDGKAEARYGPFADQTGEGVVANPPELYDPATGLWTLGAGDPLAGGQLGMPTLRAGGQKVVARRYAVGARQARTVRDLALEQGISESALVDTAVRRLLASPVADGGGRPAAGGGTSFDETYDPATGTWVGDGGRPQARANRTTERRRSGSKPSARAAAEEELWALLGDLAALPSDQRQRLIGRLRRSQSEPALLTAADDLDQDGSVGGQAPGNDPRAADREDLATGIRVSRPGASGALLASRDRGVPARPSGRRDRPAPEPGSGLRHVVAMLASGSGAAERELRRTRLDSRYGPHEEIGVDPMTGVGISDDWQPAVVEQGTEEAAVRVAGAPITQVDRVTGVAVSSDAPRAQAKRTRGAGRMASAGRGKGKAFLVRPEIAQAVERRARQLEVSEGEVVSQALDRLWSGASDSNGLPPLVGEAQSEGQVSGREPGRSHGPARASGPIVDPATGVVITSDDSALLGSARARRAESADGGDVLGNRPTGRDRSSQAR